VDAVVVIVGGVVELLAVVDESVGNFAAVLNHSFLMDRVLSERVAPPDKAKK